MYYEVVPTKIFRAGSGVLTYSSALPLKPGHVVRIPLGRAHVNGIVVKKVAESQVNFKTKPIEQLLYDTPLPAHLVSSLTWLAEYYLAPLPQVASLILPVGVEKKRRAAKTTGPIAHPNPEATHPNPATASALETPLNSHQSEALTALRSLPAGTKLLHGITGSGKTNIYLKLAEETLQSGRSVILLVPEISLTSQLVQVFCEKLKRRVTLIHSRETESERHQIWEKLLNSTQPEIVIGPRSALFSPLKNLGLIIIDEAHESAYFQENTPKYSAVRLASFIASTAKIDSILGTATPLVTDYYIAEARHAIVPLTEKAKKEAAKPDIHVINLSERQHFTKNRYFSDDLLKSIEENLKNHRQTLIFHNRRGSAPLTICSRCGWQALCPTCYLPLTLHTDHYELVCHTCAFKTKLPHSCPACNHPDIVHKGFGTKLLESELKKLFKEAKIARFDGDNRKSETLDSLYAEVKNGDYDIIIGTQTVAKGLDLPGLATVGVVQADAGLALPDFAAEEHAFHLLTQVIGRVGRGHCEKAEVFIQTYQPTHPIISAAIRANYTDFAAYLLKKRRESHFPPYTYLAKLSVTFKTESIAIAKINAIRKALIRTKGLEISTPTPAFHEFGTNGYTWQIILKSTRRTIITSALASLDPKLSGALHLTIDPPSLL